MAERAFDVAVLPIITILLFRLTCLIRHGVVFLTSLCRITFTCEQVSRSCIMRAHAHARTHSCYLLHICVCRYAKVKLYTRIPYVKRKNCIYTLKIKSFSMSDEIRRFTRRRSENAHIACGQSGVLYEDFSKR